MVRMGSELRTNLHCTMIRDPVVMTSIEGRSRMPPSRTISFQDAPDRSQQLLELAEARFGAELTNADRELFTQTANGKTASTATASSPPRMIQTLSAC